MRKIETTLVAVSILASFPSLSQTAANESFLERMVRNTKVATDDDEFNTRSDELPNRLEKLERILRADVGNLDNLNSGLIASSRSLAAAETSFLHPRQILGITPRSPKSLGMPQAFIGHVSNLDHFEAISWNRVTKEYDFLIGDLSGEKVVFKKADRKLCLTCHQSGGPILTHFSWKEMAGNSAINLEIQKTRAEEGERHLFEVLGRHKLKPEKLTSEDQLRLNNQLTPESNYVRNLLEKNQAAIHDSVFEGFVTALSQSEFDKASYEMKRTIFDKTLLKYFKTIFPDQSDFVSRFEMPSDGKHSGLSKETFINDFERTGHSHRYTQHLLTKIETELAETTKLAMIPSLDNGLPFSLDGEIRQANRVLQATEFCRTICKPDDTECKTHLLLLGLVPNSPPGFERLYSKEAARLFKARWPANSFAYPSSVIPDRDPLKFRSKGGLTTMLKVEDKEEFLNEQILDEEDNGTAFAKQVADKLNLTLPPLGQNEAQRRHLNEADFVNYIEGQATNDLNQRGGLKDLPVLGIKGPADPKTPRPLVSALNFKTLLTDIGPVVGPACFDLSNEDLDELSDFRPERIRAALFEGPVQQLIRNNDLKPHKLVEAIKNGVHLSYAKDGCEDFMETLNASKQSGPKRERLLTEASKEQMDRSLALIQKSCTECHAKGGDSPLPLDNLHDLKVYAGKRGKTVIALLDAHQMPPKSADYQLSPEERSLLIATLESCPVPDSTKVLPEKTVPGNHTAPVLSSPKR